MKIPSLPEVLFDEFPTDESIKLCVFTKPQFPQPLPDLSHRIGDLLILCTETTFSLLGRSPQKLHHSLFQLLPESNHWMKLDDILVPGLVKSFACATIPTGDIINSVMLLIFLEENPAQFLLYTGSFKTCHQVLFDNLLNKYKEKITDIYLDNSMAGSVHNDQLDHHRACQKIKNIIDKYPSYEIHLEMDLFNSMDLLVDLAHLHRINVKIPHIHQMILYRTKYKHLFEYDSSHLVTINENFQLKDRPKVKVNIFKERTKEEYKRAFQTKKIITIMLTPNEVETLWNIEKNGFTYIKYSSNAGVYTLSQLFEIIEPQRVHPMIDYGNNPLRRIPENILNEGCQIVHSFQDPNNVI